MDSEEERVAATVVKVLYLYIHVLHSWCKAGANSFSPVYLMPHSVPS